MSDLARQDAAARRAARTRFDVPLALEAGAGTGKTATLVARVAIWCLTGGWERARAALGDDASDARVAARALERVAMVTFTEKAAVEMEERIAAALRRLSRGKAVRGLPEDEAGLAPELLRARASALSGALDRLGVDTIHAFCGKLLARHALAADLHPGFAIDAEGTVVRAVCAEVVADALPATLGARADADWLALVERGHGPQAVLEALRTLVSERVTPAELARDPCSDEALQDFAAALAARCEALALGLGKALPEEHVKHLELATELCAALADLAAGLRQARSVHDLDDSLVLDAKLAKRLGEYGKSAFNKTEQKHFGEHMGELAAAAEGLDQELALVRDLDVALGRAARAVLVPLVREVDARLAATGVLTFADLLVRARDLVRDDASVRETVRRDIDQFLVDEFQDTDRVQCELVRDLALGGASESRPGLFVVGDPKQSIYGWRSADLEAYEGLLDDLRAAGGELHRLSVNYRSSQVVLDEVARLVAPNMLPEPGLQPAFEPLVEGRDAPPPPAALWDAGRAPVEHWSGVDPELAASGAKTSAERARVIEARRIAAELAELSASGVELERCALLLRTATYQEIYLEALREFGVPYAVGKDKGYFRTREIVDAIALVACVLDPTDALALATFLRSPLCGAPDAALAPLWREGLPGLCARLDGEDEDALEAACAVLPRALEAAREALAGDDVGREALARVAGWELCAESGLRSLHHLRRAFAREGADVAVERLRAWLCPEIGEAARFPGAHRLANLEHFFPALVEALRSARGGAAGVLRELRAGLSGEREARSAAPGEAGAGAVRVLTVHAAKGLQFRCVWLADLHHGSRERSGPENAARVDELDGVREIELFGAGTLARARIRTRRARIAAAESVRLLYVAATRAEDRLVLTGLPGNAGASASQADLVAKREGGTAWAELHERHGADGVFSILAADARWVLAAQSASDQPPRRDARAAANIAATPARGEERQQAALHRARALVAPISSSALARERAQRERGEGHRRAQRDVARAVGVAVHSALEHWPIGAADARARARAALDAALAPRVPASALAAASEQAAALLASFAASPLAARLDALAGTFHARELALVLRGEDDAGPAGAWVGAADLVFEEPGGLVVVDFKTDREASDDALLATYAPQLALYARALAASLGRPVLRGELWRVGEGRALEVALAPQPG